MADDGEVGGTICCICYEVLKPLSQNLQAISVCGHVFHELCLKQWFEYCESAKKFTTCPVCKQSCEGSDARRLYFQSLGDVPLRKIIDDFDEDKERAIRKLEDESKTHHQMHHNEMLKIIEKKLKMILACHDKLLKKITACEDKHLEVMDLTLGIVKKINPDDAQLKEALLRKLVTLRAEFASMPEMSQVVPTVHEESSSDSNFSFPSTN